MDMLNRIFHKDRTTKKIRKEDVSKIFENHFE